MKIVIDIPEKTYKRIKESSEINYYELLIANGTVLPKGHGELIDRNALSQTAKENYMDTSKLHYDDLVNAEHVNCGVSSVLDDIEDAPTVISADKGMCYNCQSKTDSCQEGLHCIRDYEDDEMISK